MKTRKRHEFTDEELDRERTPVVDFNKVPWKTDIRVIRERINKTKKVFATSYCSIVCE